MSNSPVNAEDLYLYAMHLLEPGEMARLEAFLSSSPEARAELAAVQSDLSFLALAVEQQTVPAASRQRLMNEVAREHKGAVAAETQAVGATPTPQRSAGLFVSSAQDSDTAATAAPVRIAVQDAPRRGGIFSALLPWAGWAVAAGLAISTWNFHQQVVSIGGQVALANQTAARATANSARAQIVLETLRSSSSQRFLLTKQNTPPAPSARVTYLASTGSLVFQGNNLEALPADKTYELWLIPAEKGSKPIPAGTFKPDARGSASVILPELPKGTAAKTFGVTMEDDGGSQAPTLPILMIGA